MKKSVYSLVLTDEVVRAVDRLAYSHGVSRSQLIDQLLAERVALITPAKYLRMIFDEMSRRFETYQNFQVQSQAAGNMYSIRSVLRYKYNPTIKYALIMQKKEDDFFGELRIVSRTQSELLYGYLNAFFDLWSACEMKHNRPGWVEEEGGKWLRSFIFNYPEGLEMSSQVAAEIAAYIRALDEGLVVYFERSKHDQSAAFLIDQCYGNYLKKCTLVF